jgi:hypothetical protein
VTHAIIFYIQKLGRFSHNQDVGQPEKVDDCVIVGSLWRPCHFITFFVTFPDAKERSLSTREGRILEGSFTNEQLQTSVYLEFTWSLFG